jgi:hypothetical protein
MKHRIIENNGYFYPQYKFFFIWWYFTEIKWADLCGYVSDEVYFLNKTGAEIYIKNRIKKFHSVPESEVVNETVK